MPKVPLASSQPATGERFYVDTSAVFSLAQAEAALAGLPADKRELARANDVRQFLARSGTAGAVVATTVLVFEELAALSRNRIRLAEAKSRGHANWIALKTSAPTDASSADLAAHNGMLALMKLAADAVGKAGIQVERAAVAVSETVTSASRLRKYHRQLLVQHVRLDAMDALHIALGLELGIKNFITFDGGWDSVSAINVLS